MFQYKHSRNWTKEFHFWVIGFALGLLVGSVPLIGVEPQTDPADEMSSYLVWWTGLFLSAMVLSIAQSDRVWRWAIAVGLGFLTAIIFDIFIGEHFFLFPFSIILYMGIGAPPVFGGAYLGKLVKWLYVQRRKGGKSLDA
jgi:hypothetical protein